VRLRYGDAVWKSERGDYGETWPNNFLSLLSFPVLPLRPVFSFSPLSFPLIPLCIYGVLLAFFVQLPPPAVVGEMGRFTFTGWVNLKCRVRRPLLYVWCRMMHSQPSSPIIISLSPSTSLCLYLSVQFLFLCLSGFGYDWHALLLRDGAARLLEDSASVAIMFGK
jgi:hypothetical protein